MLIIYHLSHGFLGATIKYSANLYSELKEHKPMFPGLEEMAAIEYSA